MKHLQKYPLDFKKTYPYIVDHVTRGRTLEILDQIPFDQGSFFTVLPDGSDIERKYEFDSDNIVPQEPFTITTIDSPSLGKLVGVEKKNIKNDCIDFVFQYLKQKKDHCAILDYTMGTPGCKYTVVEGAALKIRYP